MSDRRPHVWLLQRTDSASGVTVIIDALLPWMASRRPAYRVDKVVQRSQEQSWAMRRRPRLIRVLDDVASFVRLMARLLRERPDVVVTFTPAFGAAAAFLARSWGGRTVATHHQPRDAIQPLARWIDAAAVRLGAVHTVVACSEAVADTFTHSHGRRPLVVANGVPDVQARMDRTVDRVQLAELHGIPEGAPLAFAAGRLSPAKQHGLLIEALVGARDWHLLVAGEGLLREALLRRAQELGVGDRVHLAGRLEGPRVWSLMALADAYVQPSLAEGMSLALLEALSAGAVCLVSDIAPNVEVVAEGSAGVSLPTQDPARWAKALTTLNASPAETAALRGRARRAFEERFTQEHMLDGYERAIVAAKEA